MAFIIPTVKPENRVNEIIETKVDILTQVANTYRQIHRDLKVVLEEEHTYGELNYYDLLRLIRHYKSDIAECEKKYELTIAKLLVDWVTIDIKLALERARVALIPEVVIRACKLNQIISREKARFFRIEGSRDLYFQYLTLVKKDIFWENEINQNLYSQSEQVAKNHRATLMNQRVQIRTRIDREIIEQWTTFFKREIRNAKVKIGQFKVPLLSCKDQLVKLRNQRK